jgi:hypothetical protein
MTDESQLAGAVANFLELVRPCTHKSGRWDQTPLMRLSPNRGRRRASQDFRVGPAGDSCSTIEGGKELLRGCTHSRPAREGDCLSFYFVFFEHKEALCIPFSAQLGIIRHVEVT